MLFGGKNMGTQPSKMNSCSPLGCLVKHWGNFGRDALTREQLVNAIANTVVNGGHLHISGGHYLHISGKMGKKMA